MKEYKGKYTLEIVIDLAKRCQDYKEFREKYNGAYCWLLDNRLVHKVKPLIAKPPHPTAYTKEEVINIALKCKNKKEFRKEFSGACSWASNNNCLKEITALIPDTIRPTKHTKETAMRIAKKYNSLGLFCKERNDIHAFLRRSDFFEEATAHMSRGSKSRSFEEIKTIVKKYTYWDELKKQDRKIYNYIKTTSYGKKAFVPKYIKERGHPLQWTKKMVIYEMKKYKNIKEIKKNKIALYQRAVVLGLITNWDKKIYPFRRWTKENLIKICKKYRFLGALIMNEGNAPINAAKAMGFELPLLKVQYCGETYLRHFLEKLLGFSLKKQRPRFLRNIELDGYNSDHGIAFEHDGHFHRKDPFNKLEKVQARDLLKVRLCKENNIKVIHINDIIYDFKMNEEKIKEELKKQFTLLDIEFDPEKLKHLMVFDKKVKINQRSK